MDKKGRLFVFEGMDGAGKTSQRQHLAEELKKRGFEVALVFEPGDTEIGGIIRKILLDVKHTKMDPVTELFLYAADRRQHVTEKILPFLEAGKIVLADRFTFSTVAYQGYGRGLDKNLIDKVNDLATQGLTADLTFILDIDREKSLERIAKARAGADRLEQEKTLFFNKVRQGFLELGKGNSAVKIIDASQNEEKVFGEILEAALGILK